MSAFRIRVSPISRQGRARVLSGFLLASLILIPVRPVAAQSGQEAPSPSPSETGPGVIAALLAGIQGTDPEPHFFGGVNAGYMASQWAGAEGVALAGTGGDYRSLLVGAGPTLRFVTRPGGELRVWVGGGWYRESLSLTPGSEPGTANRGSGVAMGGLQARVPAGSVGVTAGILYWTGRFEEPGFVEPASFHGFRLTLGVAR